MWLGRWLGRRKVEADDEPARFAPPESAKTPQPGKNVRGSVGDARMAATPVERASNGFDPYNSGSFQRGQAWERVIRR